MACGKNNKNNFGRAGLPRFFMPFCFGADFAARISPNANYYLNWEILDNKIIELAK